jgi:3-methyladenine DNA glycosylase AlkD
MSKVNEVINKLLLLSNKANAEGMKRFGINTKTALGIRIPDLRRISKLYKHDHELALDLWKTNYHEARILATMIDNPKLLTSSQIDDWTHDIDSWDLCDQTCNNLFSRSDFVVSKIEEFTSSSEEFVKRTGFSMIATYAVKAKTVDDLVFFKFLNIIEQQAWDNRNFVKKAVNWALRQIGKKNFVLHARALQSAQRILSQEHPSAKWIAKNAIKELQNKKFN